MTAAVGQRRIAVAGPVLIIGTGLIGTSIALSLRRAGVEVLLEDTDPEQVATAESMGAGRPLAVDERPTVVVVAVPPRWAPSVIASASARFAGATVTDVTSVKDGVLVQAQALGADMARVVGGHPMAGREVSGAAGARADLMDDRWWILTPTPQTGAAHLEVVRQLAATCGAYLMQMSPQEHDQAVALVSHAPQVVASSLAAQLVGAREDFVRICGQGLRDTTRIAGSDSSLWTDILAANARPVAEVLAGVIQTLSETLQGLDAAGRGVPDGSSAVTRTLESGAAGRARIPGKHGADALEFAVVAVMVADRPGELARLFVAAGEADINLEDVRIEHVLGRPSGLVELSVRHESAEPLSSALRERGFDVRSEAVAGA